MLAGTGLREEGGEGIVAGGLVGRHLAVGLDAMLQAVQLPASIAHLDAGLAHVNGDTLAHDELGVEVVVVDKEVEVGHEVKVSANPSVVENVNR